MIKTVDPKDVEVLAEWCRNKPEDAAIEILAMRKGVELRLEETREPSCWCMACDEIERAVTGNPLAIMRMNLCPECGNKRCPRATNHLYECTGSNEPGQSGSAY